MQMSVGFSIVNFCSVVLSIPASPVITQKMAKACAVSYQKHKLKCATASCDRTKNCSVVPSIHSLPCLQSQKMANAHAGVYQKHNHGTMTLAMLNVLK